MKKFLALLLALALVYCTGCSKVPTSEEVTPPPLAEEPQQTPPPEEAPEPSLERPGLQEGQFVFTRENFPKLDGSTSTVPLAQAMASILLSEPQAQVEDLIHFTRTTNSYRALIYQDNINGKADLLLAAEPAESIWEEKAEKGAEWNMKPFAIDGLIFVVNADNPVDSLTVEQVQKIYTGEITNWSEVGGDDVEIAPFQRNEEAGSQTMMKKLVMGDLPLMEPEMEYRFYDMAGTLEAVREYEDSASAIGYSVYYYANDMRMAEGLKILQIDGIAPDADSFRDQSYPFTNPYYVVMRSDREEKESTTTLFQWILGKEGQRLVDQLGYVAVQPPGEEAAEEAAGSSVYANWSMLENITADVESYPLYWQEPKTELIPHDGYGLLTPFFGKELTMKHGYPGSLLYQSTLYGLATIDGEVVVEPVYTNIKRLSWNDEPLPVFLLQKTATDEEWLAWAKEACWESWEYGDHVLDYTYGLAAADGSWYIPLEYAYAVAISSERILLVDSEGKFWLCDRSGNIKECPLKENASTILGENWQEDLNCEYYEFIDGLFVITIYGNSADSNDQCMWVDFQTGEITYTLGEIDDYYDYAAAHAVERFSDTGLAFRKEYYLGGYAEGVYDTVNDTWLIEPDSSHDRYFSFVTDEETDEIYILCFTDEYDGPDKYTTYNSAGELLFEADSIMPPVNGIFPICNDGRSGLIDAEGNWVMHFVLRSNID